MNGPEEKKVSRRGFLQSSTSAAVGGTLLSQLGAPRVASGKPNTQTLRVGLIGCGGRGTGAAMNALQADKNVALTAMADLFEDNLDRSLTILREKVPDKVRVDRGRRFLGMDAASELIGSSEVDVVILATPPAFRPRQLAAAIAAGKHAFVEITAAIDAPGVRSVLASAQMAKEKGLAIVSGFCWRYDPALRAAQEQIREGAIGEVRAMYATYLRSNLGHKFKGPKTPGMSDLEMQIRDWYHHLWLSGDVTILLSGGHSVDKMSWWVGDEMPTSAVGVGSQVFPNWGNTYDNAFVTYEYESGMRGFLGCRSQSGCFNDNGDEVIGTKGVFKFHGRRPVIEGETNWEFEGTPGNKYQEEHDALLGSIRSGKPINDGERMAKTTLMAIMGRMAAYTGKRIEWEAAMNSKQALVPETLDWDTKVEDIPLAVAGVTEFV